MSGKPETKKRKAEKREILNEIPSLTVLRLRIQDVFQQLYRDGVVQLDPTRDGYFHVIRLCLNQPPPGVSLAMMMHTLVVKTGTMGALVAASSPSPSPSPSPTTSPTASLTFYTIEDEAIRNKVAKIVLRNANLDASAIGVDMAMASPASPGGSMSGMSARSTGMPLPPGRQIYLFDLSPAAMLAWICMGKEYSEGRRIPIRLHRTASIAPDMSMQYFSRAVSPLCVPRRQEGCQSRTPLPRHDLM